jgi:hypothetical protein
LKTNISTISSQLRLPFPVELPGDLRDLLLQCIDFDPNRRPEFADIKLALHSLALIDEGNWKTLKSNWRSMKFNYTISAGFVYPTIIDIGRGIMVGD